MGLFVMIGGLIYAELGTRLLHTGGEYAYITRCFGPFAGFMFGWAQLFIIRTSPGAGLATIAAESRSCSREWARGAPVGPVWTAAQALPCCGEHGALVQRATR